MRKVLGVLVGIFGVLGAMYIGIAIVLVGGIEEIVDGASANPVNGSKIAWGIIKILAYDSVIGVIAFLVLCLAYLIAGSRAPRLLRRRRRRVQRARGFQGRSRRY